LNEHIILSMEILPCLSARLWSDEIATHPMIHSITGCCSWNVLCSETAVCRTPIRQTQPKPSYHCVGSTAQQSMLN